MNYERKYKEALEKAQKALEVCGTDKCETARQIFSLFPELKENERVKSCISMILTDANETRFNDFHTTLANCLAWLKKQKPIQNINKEDEEVRQYIVRTMEQKDINVPMVQKALAWLEKQEGCEYIKKDWLEHIKQSWYKEGFIDGKYSGGTSKEWTINDAATLKELIDFLENGTAKLQHDLTKYANWLKIQFTPIEKQGRQFSADKLEPKFKVGDWVVISTSGGEKVVQIDSIEHFKSGEPMYITSEGRWFGNGTKAHLWTIQDAKDGDVLAVEPIKDCPDSFIAIYKERGLNFFNSYCFVSLDGEFNKGTTGHDIYLIHPATKEQRDTLFAKMTEAGYEWDAEKKELKKIEDEEYNGEDYGIDSLYHAQRILEKTLGSVDGYQTDDGILSHKCAITAVKKLYEQKPVWSEEDEDYYDAIVAKLEVTQDDAALTDNQMEFLKSLKSRVQLKQEWSEEDKERLTSCIQLLKTSDGFDTINTKWLKSLKERYTWKPSGEQMKALDNFIFAKYPNIEKYEKSVKSLYQDLMKLKT